MKSFRLQRGSSNTNTTLFSRKTLWYVMWYLIYNKSNIQLYKYVQSICICELSRFTKYNQVLATWGFQWFGWDVKWGDDLSEILGFLSAVCQYLIRLCGGLFLGFLRTGQSKSHKQYNTRFVMRQSIDLFPRTEKSDALLC